MPGPPPKPTRLKLLQGNPGKRGLNQNEPQPRKQESVPRVPEMLGEVGKREWLRVGRLLIDLGLLTDLDLTAFLLYCKTYERWLQAEEQLQLSGLLVKTPNGHQVQSPYLAIANKAMAQLKSISQEFGMTPASRSRVGVDPGNKDGRFADWLFNG